MGKEGTGASRDSFNLPIYVEQKNIFVLAAFIGDSVCNPPPYPGIHERHRSLWLLERSRCSLSVPYKAIDPPIIDPEKP